MFQPEQTTFALDRRRMAARVAAHYFLQTAILITRTVDEDLVTALVFLGVSRANVRALRAEPALEAAYSARGAVPPEDLRRPVSVYAVAKDLGLPYETVRRHAGKLREAGMLEADGRGLWAPNRVHATGRLQEALEENWEMSRRFLRDAITIGIVPAPAPATLPQADVSRRAVRLALEFFLDSLGLMARTVNLDPLSIMIGLAVARANMEYFAADRATSEAYAGLEAIPPDTVRRPVSVYAVSRSLGLPYETTRRYARRLTKDGWLERREDGGLILPASVLARPGVIDAALEFSGATQSYLATLVAIGVAPALEGAVPRLATA